MTEMVFKGPLGFGQEVEGEALVSAEAFSPRYDLDRATGVISRKGHPLEGVSIAGKILVLPAVKGGVAAGWALLNLRERAIAPVAIICSKTNPVFVQGCVVARIPIMHRLSPDPFTVIQSGLKLRVSPQRGEMTVSLPDPASPSRLRARCGETMSSS